MEVEAVMQFLGSTDGHVGAENVETPHFG